MIVRQIRKTDLDGLHKLAKKAGTGITTLQDDKKLLKKSMVEDQELEVIVL